MTKKTIYEAWKGSYVDSYFNMLENGNWVKVSWPKYIWLKLRGYRTRKRKFRQGGHDYIY